MTTKCYYDTGTASQHRRQFTPHQYQCGPIDWAYTRPCPAQSGKTETSSKTREETPDQKQKRKGKKVKTRDRMRCARRNLKIRKKKSYIL